MARKGNPELNEIEDSIIAVCGMAQDRELTNPAEDVLIGSIVDKVRSFLSQHRQSGEINKYAEFVEDNLKIYVCLLRFGGGQRQAIKQKMKIIFDHTFALAAELSMLSSVEIIALELAIEAQYTIDGEMSTEMRSVISDDGAKRNKFNFELRRNEFQEKLQYIIGASAALKNTFNGTAQDKKDRSGSYPASSSGLGRMRPCCSEMDFRCGSLRSDGKGF